MRRTSFLAATAAAIAVGATTACVPPTGPGPAPGNPATDCATRTRSGGALSVVGLVADGTLVCFAEGTPGQLATVGTVTGLDQDTSLVGMDYRPANDTLYAVGNAGGIYTVDAGTATVSLVSRLSQPLQGTAFGVDFNPTVDRLRIISDAGQNLRVNVVDGIGDRRRRAQHPRYAAGEPCARRHRRRLHEQRRRPEHGDDAVRPRHDERQHGDPGARQRRSLSPTGKLGVDAAGAVGFDIYSHGERRHDDRPQALASIATSDGATSLYRVDLLTGRARAIGAFAQPVVDIAIPTAQH